MDENEITNTMTTFTMTRDEAIDYMNWSAFVDADVLKIQDEQGEALCKFFDARLEVR